MMNQIEIASEAMRLPIGERLEVAGMIWDSVIKDGLPGLSPAQKSLIDERIAAADQHPDRRTPAGDVFDEMGRDR